MSDLPEWIRNRGTRPAPASDPAPPVKLPEMGDVLREAGYAPLEPYPGTPRKPWAVECLTCQRPSRVRLLGLEPCSHEAPEAPRREGTENSTMGPQEAERIIGEAGYTPLAPYPGAQGKRWRVRCPEGCVRLIRVDTVRRLGPERARCRHVRTSRR